ncbi:MAG: response regulator [Proteobacteria bacterium]|jgi:CheY-like chemotaxis protein|nr:response regulator [Pseudomonadota bacterium]
MKTALVVDDNATNRLLAATILRKLGWTVSEADSGEQAIALFPALAPRLVLLDISMPGLSGEETCARLRAIVLACRPHVVAYTAHAFQEDIDRLLAAGFDDTLIKPINRQRLEQIAAGLNVA